MEEGREGGREGGRESASVGGGESVRGGTGRRECGEDLKESGRRRGEQQEDK